MSKINKQFYRMTLWQGMNFAHEFQMDRMKPYNTVNPGFIHSVVSIGPGIMPQRVQKTFFHGTDFFFFIDGIYWLLLSCTLQPTNQLKGTAM